MAQRRSSYASIVSGAVNNPNDPPRSGVLAQINHPASVSTSTIHHHPPYSYQHRSQYSDSLQTAHGSIVESFGRTPQYPPYFDAHGPVVGGGFSNNMEQPRTMDLFIPRYLRGSRFADRLRERREVKRTSHRDTRSARSSNAGSLSTSASNLSLHKLPLSHRGAAHDVVEKSSNTSDERISLLPSRWSSIEKYAGLEFLDSEQLEVKLAGPIKSQDEAAAIRADQAIPKECGIYYFEITVEGKGKESCVAVGFSSNQASLSRPPGWEPGSFAYHGDDGHSFAQKPSDNKPYGPHYTAGDVIGCGIDFRNATAFFTRNGWCIGTAFRDVPLSSPYFPAVGMKKQGEQIKANFGQTEFVYDIISHIERERDQLRLEIKNENTEMLSDCKSEGVLLRELVAQYLAHEGFVESSKAFADDVQRTDKLLRPQSSQPLLGYKEDNDAIERQKIRNAVLEGDIDSAIKHTNRCYPSVLTNNENIYFKLRCRKFVEMIRRCSEFNSSAKAGKPGRSPSAKSSTNGQFWVTETSSREEGIFEDGMELDGQTNEEAIAADDMEVEDSEMGNGLSTKQPMYSMKDCLAYGQELQSEFKGDPRREVRQALEDTFALIAYPNAGESSLAPLLKTEGRIPVAEELNSAILVSTGKASSAALERLCQQVDVLMGDLSAAGHGASLLHMQKDFLR